MNMISHLQVFTLRYLFCFQLRREYETEKQKAMQSNVKQMEKEIERVKEDYRSKISEIEDKHKHQTSDTKKKQWVCS